MESGFLLIVNGHAHRLRSITVHDTRSEGLAVWTVEVDDSLGCAGTLEAALLMASRAAELGIFQEAKQ